VTHVRPPESARQARVTSVHARTSLCPHLISGTVQVTNPPVMLCRTIASPCPHCPADSWNSRVASVETACSHVSFEYLCRTFVALTYESKRQMSVCEPLFVTQKRGVASSEFDRPNAADVSLLTWRASRPERDGAV
jgi:hypothetical protein